MICIKSSPLEVFNFKGFLQICSKFTGEHPRENITSETHLNGQVLTVAQRRFPLRFICCVIDENLYVVAGEYLTVLWKLICINEQVELNIAKEN